MRADENLVLLNLSLDVICTDATMAAVYTTRRVQYKDRAMLYKDRAMA